MQVPSRQGPATSDQDPNRTSTSLGLGRWAPGDPGVQGAMQPKPGVDRSSSGFRDGRWLKPPKPSSAAAGIHRPSMNKGFPEPMLPLGKKIMSQRMIPTFF